jgi:hypothetical protein
MLLAATKGDLGVVKRHLAQVVHVDECTDKVRLNPRRLLVLAAASGLPTRTSTASLRPSAACRAREMTTPSLWYGCGFDCTQQRRHQPHGPYVFPLQRTHIPAVAPLYVVPRGMCAGNCAPCVVPCAAIPQGACCRADPARLAARHTPAEAASLDVVPSCQANDGQHAQPHSSLARTWMSAYDDWNRTACVFGPNLATTKLPASVCCSKNARLPIIFQLQSRLLRQLQPSCIVHCITCGARLL